MLIAVNRGVSGYRLIARDILTAGNGLTASYRLRAIDCLVTVGRRGAGDMLIAVDGGIACNRLVARDILAACDSLATSNSL